MRSRGERETLQKAAKKVVLYIRDPIVSKRGLRAETAGDFLITEGGWFSSGFPHIRKIPMTSLTLCYCWERKKEKITQFLSYFPKYYWHKNVLHCQSSHVFLLLNLSVYLLNVHKISAKSCVTRQNDGWYASSLTVTKFQNFPKNS